MNTKPAAASCRVGALLAMLCAVPSQAIAVPFVIDTEVTIHWDPPLSLAAESFTGASSFQTGYFLLVTDTIPGTIFVPTSTFGNMAYLAAPEDSASPMQNSTHNAIPPGPPGVPVDLIWQFGGISHTGLGDFATCAFDPFFDSAHPPSPCTGAAPPLITLGQDFMPGFAPIDLTGAIYAFDDPVQVGTWEIHVSEFLPSAVPEPASLVLFGIGFAALAARRRPGRS